MPRDTPMRGDARQRIEDAAVSLFAERPFHQVGLDAIASRARASLQTVYRYYGGKEAILNACLHRWARELSVRMADHLQGIENYKDRLRKVFWVVLDYFERNPDVARMIQHTISAEPVQRDVTDEQRMLTEVFLRVLREGREQGVLTSEISEKHLLDYFYGVLMRLVQMHIARGETEPLAAKTPELFAVLWRALAAPGSA